MNSVDDIVKKPAKSTIGRSLKEVFLGRPLRIFISVVFVGIIILPIFYIAMTSIKIPLEISLSGALFPAMGITGVNWINAFRTVPLVQFLFNSTVAAVISTVIVIAVAIPATYSIIRFNTGGWFLPTWIIGTYVMPPIVVSIPVFAMVKLVHLQNNLIGLILVYAMANLPVAVWLLDSYIRNLPKELEYAAWVDGYGKFETLLRVVFPLIRPGVVSAAVICMILSWNEFLFALLLTYSPVSNTFTIGISRFIGQHGMQFGEMSAAALAGIIPIYVIVLLFSRNVVEGLTRGGVKG
jgi:multiple sugar transport system permease protein